MNKFISLMKVNIKGIIRGRENKKKKLLSHGIILILASALIFYYSYKFANLSMKGFKVINSEFILLPEFFAISSVLLIFTNYKKINDLFFKNTDYDLLESMPIKRHYIIISKMVELYISALLTTLAFMIPAYVVYINNVSVDVMFNVLYFVSLLFVPCIPVVIATVIGYLMSYISTFFKRKDLVQLITGIAVFFIAFYIGKNSFKIDVTQMSNFGKMLLNFFNNYYPMTIFYKDIVIDQELLSLLWYLVINVISFALITFIITKTYTFINSKLHQVSSSKNTKIKELNRKSPTAALLKKDFRKLFTSSNYLLNTCVGIIVLILCVIGLLTSSNIGITVVSELSGNDSKTIFAYCMLMFTGYIYPTAVSTSLEGKNFYILRVLPISFKNIIREKNLFHIIMGMPVALITILAIIFKTEMKIKYAIPLFMLYIIVTLFHANFHLLLDMLFLNIHWENEIKVVKRSIQSILSLVIAIFLGVFPLLSRFDKPYKIYLFAGGMLILTIASYVTLRTFGEKKFNNTLN